MQFDSATLEEGVFLSSGKLREQAGSGVRFPRCGLYALSAAPGAMRLLSRCLAV